MRLRLHLILLPLLCSARNLLRGTINGVWSTRNGMIMFNNTIPYIIRGTNWHGIESDCKVPHGLWVNSINFYLDLLENNGFNSIRIPVSYEIMSNLSISVENTCLDVNPQYMGYTSGEFLKDFMNQVKQRGVTILVDQHTIMGEIQSYPWTAEISGDQTIDAWVNFLKVFSNDVFAIELKNEPHNDCTLFTFLEWCKNAIRRIERETNYKGLYFISGTQLSTIDNNKNHAWGGTFNDLKFHPDLMNNFDVPYSRLVFCPHVYGTSVRSDSVGNDDFSVWDSDFGFIKTTNWQLNNIPIIFSEMGGFLKDSDLNFYNRFKDYAFERGLNTGLYWWSFPSTSQDTGGLLENDFQTIDWNKMNYIKSFIPSPTYLS